jgi:hypothetical protein
VHQVTAVGEPLERVVGGPVGPELQERIEAMEDVPEGGIELASGRGEGSAVDGQVDQRRVGHVIDAVFGEPRVEQDLRLVRALLPHQAHVHGLDALHRYQRRDFAAYGLIEAVRRGLGMDGLQRARVEGAEQEGHRRGE